jgi:hypothetical protein
MQTGPLHRHARGFNFGINWDIIVPPFLRLGLYGRPITPTDPEIFANQGPSYQSISIYFNGSLSVIGF